MLSLGDYCLRCCFFAMLRCRHFRCFSFDAYSPDFSRHAAIFTLDTLPCRRFITPPFLMPLPPL